MFDIAVDECGRTCKAYELVAGNSAAQRGNAKKRKYFCVACVNAKHPVFLKIRDEKQLLVGNSRNYTALAWFSHYGSGGGGNCEMDRPNAETTTHWHAKHILSEHASRYWFITEKCTGCEKHTKIENGVQAIGRVEFREKACGGNVYCFDAVLMRGEPDKMVVTTVMEVWATHETSEDKRKYCWDKGYMFGEFHADHVVEAYGQAAPNTSFLLENLKIRLFECSDCAQLALQKKNDILVATADAERTRVWEAEALLFVMAEQQQAAAELRANKVRLCLANKVRLCVKCRTCVPLVRFLSRDDGACDGHTTEKQGGCRFARCGTCKRIPSEGCCECEHTCECFACWEYKDNINRAAMSQGCRYGICGICFQDNSNYHVKCCICKWLCGCKNCVIFRNDSNQGCFLADCATCGGRAGETEPSCDCEHTCGCFSCREDRADYQSDVLSGKIIPPEYEQNEGCKFSASGVCKSAAEESDESAAQESDESAAQESDESAAEESDESETDQGYSNGVVYWLCKCRYCRHSRSDWLHKNNALDAAARNVAKKEQDKQQCIRQNLAKRLVYKSKISLKTAAKRALAQRKYASTVAGHALAKKTMHSCS